MFDILYAGRMDMDEANETCTERTDHGHKMCDIRMGLDFARERGHDIPLTISDLEDFGYTYVGTTTLNDPERVFCTFQGEYMNEALRHSLRILGARHTSMSVGDVLVEVGTGRVLFCDRFGFVEV